MLYHPSQHTIEGARYEAEFVMNWTNSSGTLNVSVPVQSSPRESSSSTFFGAIVPYATDPTRIIPVTLGNNWSLSHAFPSEPSYFVYTGTDLIPPCDGNKTWIVYRFPININPNDLANLVKNYPSGYRPIQALGTGRKLYFNNGQNLKQSPETAQSNDDRIYIRCTKLEDDKKIQDARSFANTANSLFGNLDQSASGISSKLEDSKKLKSQIQGVAHLTNYYIENTGGYWLWISIIIYIIIGILAFYLGKSLGGMMANSTSGSIFTNQGIYNFTRKLSKTFLPPPLPD